MNERIAAIILNYNNSQDTITLLQQLAKQTITVTPVVIDNHSKPEAVRKLKAFVSEQPDVKLIELTKNRGYATGNNQGIQYALDHNFDYLCIMNNDITIKKELLSDLLEATQMLDNPGLVGPLVYDDLHKVSFAGANINLKTGRDERYEGKQALAMLDKNDFLRTEMVLGACMMVKATVIKKVGLIPEDYFLNYEESEWALNILKAGYQNYYIKSAIIHHVGRSMATVKGVGAYFMYRNRVIFVKRNATWQQKLFFTFFLPLSLTKEAFKVKSLKPFVFSWDGVIGRNRYAYLQK
ncbi:glycosyltransferase family 2 protein [Latilactobacillus sakei]|uniref:glycosyltransferase family 2 protein n=1 Tax=Latilactobacillus sakei TaxID=1599 RepID=UPI000C13873A|nr:glycosyltransferase family 2 protein [Latilactobacillus sakei]RXA81542.1 glycosyltransferase family 2 protein [Latilactobacillus sakei]SOB39694.1 putative Glycosyl transferase 2 family protein [Latilactobacillus sakei]